MKRWIMLIVLFASLFGCARQKMVPPKDALAGLRCIHIVPMESPPLIVPPNFRSVIPGFGGGSLIEVQGFAIFNTIAILLEMPEATKRGGEASQTIQAKLESKDPWVPTVVLANEVQTQLSTEGIKASISPEVSPIPGIKNREYTFFMRNWLGPIQDWYGSNEAVTEYSDVDNEGIHRYIIEIGIANYEITGDELLVSVMIKIINPTNSQVIGREWESNIWNLQKITPFAQAFDNDGRLFKEAFLVTTRSLVKKCLKELLQRR